jgi:dTDP-4-amino-4,6-dideoxygalactose transaminase
MRNVAYELVSESADEIAVCRPLLPTFDKIAPYLSSIDAQRRYTNHGDLVLELQRRLRGTFDLPSNIVAASCGTAAIAGAILGSTGRATKRRPLCLLPAYTFIGTLSAVELCGFTPYFVDINPTTWALDPERCLLHSMIDRVGLVVPVAPYGRPVAQAGWKEFRDRTCIPVVVDGAAAFAGIVTDPESTLGDIPVAVSFHATKAFAAGEGGAVFCNNPDMSMATLQCLNFGYKAGRPGCMSALNGKMSEYHAAVALAELDGWASKRAGFHRVAHYYLEAAGRSNIDGQFHLSPSIAPSYTIFEAATSESAIRIQAALRANHIGYRMWYGSGLHRLPYCSSFDRDTLTQTENLSSRLIGLPMSCDMKHKDVSTVVRVVYGCL